MPRAFLLAFLVASALALGATPCAAQVEAPWDPRGLKMEREELEDLLARLISLAQSSAYSGSTRDEAARDADLIRERLEGGDFRVGDRIRLQVEGEDSLPESLPVEPGPRITLPLVGSISLAGVLRSELEAHLTREIGRFIHEPVVRSESLVRVAVLGTVGRPGFYTVPSDLLVGDALMLAGGPTTTADMESIRIERAGEILWEGPELQQALAEGRTLDQLNVMAGDQIVVQPIPTGRSVVRSVLVGALTLITTVMFGVRAF